MRFHFKYSKRKLKLLAKEVVNKSTSFKISVLLFLKNNPRFPIYVGLPTLIIIFFFGIPAYLNSGKFFPYALYEFKGENVVTGIGSSRDFSDPEMRMKVLAGDKEGPRETHTFLDRVKLFLQSNAEKGVDIGFDLIKTGDAKSQARKPETIGDQITYYDVVDGVDFRYTSIPDKGIKEEIILKDKNNCVTQKTCELKFRVFFDPGVKMNKSLSVKSDKDQYIWYFTDASGNYLAHFQPLTINDANGNENFNIKFELENDRVHLIPDYDWLTSTSTEYPVIIDPTIVHDTEVEFDTGSALNRLDSITGPKVQQTYMELPADENTVALYHMNEVSGNLIDSSGNGYSGVNISSTMTNGKIGNGRLLNGSSDYITVADNTTLDILGSQTVESWVKINTGGWVVTKDQNSSSRSFRLFITGTQLEAYIIANNGAYIARRATISIDSANWHHIAFTYDGGMTSNSILLFLDGALQITSDISGGGSFGGRLDNAGSIRIGGLEYNNSYYSGSIDEVRISNTARSADDIKNSARLRPYGTYVSSVLDLGSTPILALNSINWQEYGVRTVSGEIPYSTSGLIAQWDFNESSGTTAVSEGACGVNCNMYLKDFGNTDFQDEVINSGWTNNNKRWGEGAINFNGIDNYICIDSNEDSLCDDNNSFDFGSSNDFTIETWIRIENTTGYNFIFHKGQACGTSYASNYYYFAIADGKLAFASANGYQYDSANSLESITPGQWHHIAAVIYNLGGSLGDYNFYLDGKKLTTQLSHDGTSGAPANTSNSPIVAGCRQYDQSVSTDYESFQLDSLRVYDRSLSEDELLANSQNSNIEFQTRTGADDTPDDGSWEDWKPLTAEVQMESMDSGQFMGSYTADITVTNTGTTITNGTVNFTMNTSTPISAGKMAINCSDLEFVDSDGATILGYTLVSGCNSASTAINVLIPSIPNGSKTIKAYYGNTSKALIENTYASNNFTTYGKYWKTITISSGSTGSNVQVLVTLDTATLISQGKMNSSCIDINFIDSDDVSPLNYWIEGGCNTTTTQIWILVPSIPVGTKDIKVVYGSGVDSSYDQSYAAGSTIIPFQGSCPSGYSSFTSLDNRLPRGSATYGGTGGASTHTHGISINISASGSAISAVASGSTYAAMSHIHSLTGTPTINSGTNYPNYITTRFCSNNKLWGNSTSMAFYESASMPSGWSRVSALDGYYMLGSSTTGWGSVNNVGSHTHGFSFSTGGPSATQTGSAGSSSVATNSHTHTGSGTSGAYNNLPTYRNMVVMLSGSDTYMPVGSIVTASTLPPYGWTRYTNMDGYFLRGSSTYGTAGGTNIHGTGHTVSGTTSSVGSGTPRTNNGGNKISIAHSHSYSGTLTDTNTTPPYLDVLYIKKNTSLATSVGTENSLTGSASTETSVSEVLNKMYSFSNIRALSDALRIEGNNSQKIETGKYNKDSFTTGLWHFDETGGSGAYIKDFSGKGNDGTPTGTTLVAGISGKARSFNGSSDFIKLGTSTNADIVGDISIEAWINPTLSSNSVLVHKGFQYSLYIQSGNGYVQWADSSNFSYSNFGLVDIGLVANKWQHIAVTKTGGVVKIYLDGVLKLSRSFGSNLTSTSNTMLIGCYGDASVCNSNYFSGAIDELRISNVARTEEEIYESYRMGSGTKVTRTITTSDLTNSNQLPVWLAADRPGSYTMLEVGESAYVNNEPDGNTVGLWKMDEKNSVFQNLFIGNTIDSTKWLEFDPNSNKVSQNNGLILSAGSLTSWDSGIISKNPVPRKQGNTIYAKFTTSSSVAAPNHMMIGWGQDQTASGSYNTITHALYFNAGSFQVYQDGSLTGGPYGSGYTINTTYEVLITLNSNGTATYRIKGGVYTNWTTLLASDTAKTSVTLRPQIAQYQHNGTFTELKVTYNMDIADYSYSNNNGRAYGTSVVQGISNNARYFDGNLSYIDIPDNNSLDFGSTGDFTMEAWFKVDSVSDYRAVLWKSNSCDPNCDGYYIYVGQNTGYATCGIDGDGAGNYAEIQDATDHTSKGWTHLVCTVDRDNPTGFKMYINGMLAVVGDPTNVGSINNANTLKIGISRDGVSYPFVGSIDNVRVSNIIRSPQEIRQIYEIGKRSHEITVDFAANLNSGNLISNSSDTSFTVDSTVNGVTNPGDNLYVGDKVIVRENYNGTEYIAQGTVNAVNVLTGAASVSSWDAGSTFPSGGQTGFGASATVFKWQREYIDLSGAVTGSGSGDQVNQKNAITTISLNITNNNEGRTIYLDDFKANTSYISDPNAGSNIPSSVNRYLQYRTILTTSNRNVTSYFNEVSLDYDTNTAPNFTIDPHEDPISSPGSVTNEGDSVTFKATAEDDQDDSYYLAICKTNSITSNENAVPTCNGGSWCTSSANLNGDGGDGSIVINSIVDINTTNLITGRNCNQGGDAVMYSSSVSTSAGATSIELTIAPDSQCLTAGDEILIINMQGNGNVGKYETRTITSINSTVVSFAGAPLSNSYNGTTQKIMVQRIPNYTSVTINSGTLTISDWDGTKGGVLFIRATGNVNNQGNIDVSGKGYKGGVNLTDTSYYSYQGDSTVNIGSYSSSANGGGGGGGMAEGGVWNGYGNAGGGGGGFGTNGSAGTDIPSAVGGAGGSTYGDDTLSNLYLGSGGGAGGGITNAGQPYNIGGAGGDGGGIIFISAANISNSGNIFSNGVQGGNGTTRASYGGAGGGGGAGGLIVLISNSNISLGTLTSVGGSGGIGNTSLTEDGTNGGSGGVGRVLLKYTGVLNGSANPSAELLPAIPTSSGLESSCSYNAQPSDAESNDWYAFVCEHSNSSLCSLVSEGNGDSGSPFAVNHNPFFNAVFDDGGGANEGASPGGTMTFAAIAGDNDTDDISDQVKLVVCGDDQGATASGCVGTQLCISALSSANPFCNYSIPLNSSPGNYNYFGYIFDNHNLASASNYRSGQYLVNNSPSVVTDVIINNGEDITLLSNNTKSTSVTATVTDVNSCQDITTVNASLFRSGITYGNCDLSGESNDNNCYADLACTVVPGSCSGSTDNNADYVCNFEIQYFADPTEGDSSQTQYWNENWTATVESTDTSANISTADASSPVEMLSLVGISIDSSIDYGPLQPSSDTGASNVINNISATGNVGLNIELAGNNLTYNSNSIAVNNQQYKLTPFTYGSGTGLTVSPTLVNILIPKTILVSTPQSKPTYWGLQVPSGTSSGNYSGVNSIIGVRSSPVNW